MRGVREDDVIMNVGDTIKCADADDMVDTMVELAQKNIMTDFMYEKDGQKGFWLVVVAHY